MVLVAIVMYNTVNHLSDSGCACRGQKLAASSFGLWSTSSGIWTNPVFTLH